MCTHCFHFQRDLFFGFWRRGKTLPELKKRYPELFENRSDAFQLSAKALVNGGDSFEPVAIAYRGNQFSNGRVEIVASHTFRRALLIPSNCCRTGKPKAWARRCFCYWQEPCGIPYSLPSGDSFRRSARRLSLGNRFKTKNARRGRIEEKMFTRLRVKLQAKQAVFSYTITFFI